MKFRFALAACYLAAFALVGLGGLSLLPSASAQVFNQPKQSAPPPKQKVHRRPQPAKAPTAPVVKQAMPSTSTPRIATFRDPAAYCLVNLNIDEPGSTYIGQPVPGWVSSAWGGASTASANTLQSRAFNWRCMGGRVLVCSSAVGQSDCSKPVDERSPSPEILQFCSGKRKATVPPEMAGNAMPIWACKDSKPTITGYRAGLDERGYFSTLWRDVTDYSPTNLVGAVPKKYLGTWYVQMSHSAFSSTGLVVNGRQASAPSVDSVVFRISGGSIGEAVGTIEYYTRYMQNSPEMFCRVDVILVSAAPGQMVIDERLRQRNGGDRCSSTLERITLLPKDGKILVEWRRNGKPKPRKSAWGSHDQE